MFIIVKTYLKDGFANIYNEIISSHDNKSECCKALYNLIDNKHKSTILVNNVVRVHEQGWVKNTLSHIYQILEVPNKNNNNNYPKNKNNHFKHAA